MGIFKYKVLGKDGSKIDGVVQAFDQLDAVDHIKANYDIILSVEEVVEKEENFLTRDLGENKLNMKAFSVMCSQFAIILESGVPIVRAVELIADKMTNKPLKKMLLKTADDVKEGRSLTNSLEERGKKLLPVTFIETIRSGEESGNLVKAFKSMSEHYEKQIKMASKIRGALIYPAFILVIAVVVVMVLMVKVVPTFIAIFDEFDSTMPMITLSLIYVSRFFQHYWIIMLLIVLAIAIGINLYNRDSEGKMNLAKFILKLPMFGNIVRLQAASQFANNMTTLLNSGVGITKAISITSRVISNYYISTELGKIAGKVEEGATLSSSLKEVNVLPDILQDMVSVGEETGELENTLGTISHYYDNELEAAVQHAVAKLEPTILCVVAAIAGYIVIAIYVAMFAMYGSM